MNRERVQKLRDFLAGLPDKQFVIHAAIINRDGDYACPIAPAERAALREDCGTAACISGWAQLLFDDDGDDRLGLDNDQAHNLYMPPGWSNVPASDARYTRERAVATLDRLLETGEVDWGPNP